MGDSGHGDIHDIQFFMCHQITDVGVGVRTVLLGVLLSDRLVYITNCDEVVDIFQLGNHRKVCLPTASARANRAQCLVLTFVVSLLSLYYHRQLQRRIQSELI